MVDDVWAIVGSDNLNLRSWTHDSELSCAVLDATRDDREPRDPAGLGDGARRFARDLRLRLMAEHLGRRPRRPAILLDPAARSPPGRTPPPWRTGTTAGGAGPGRRGGSAPPAEPGPAGGSDPWAPRSTACSSTPTAGPGGCGGAASSDADRGRVRGPGRIRARLASG